jgi:flagellar biosynthesis protein FlhG
MIQGKRVIAVGGGKGGVGKSLVACNLAVGFAQKGYHTVLVDADLGTPNMHTLLGIEQPKLGLGDVLASGQHKLSDVLTETPVAGLSLACGAAPILGIANPEYYRKQRLLKEIGQLKADILVVDIGAGVAFNVIDFFNAADVRVVVVSPQITSMHNAYGFIKSSLHRLLQRAIRGRVGYREFFEGNGWSEEKMDQLLVKVSEVDARYLDVFDPLINSYQVILLGNMFENPKELNVVWAMQRMIKEFLLVDSHVVGGLRRSRRVLQSINRRTPFILDPLTDRNAKTIHNTVKFIEEMDLAAVATAVENATEAARFLPKKSSQFTEESGILSEHAVGDGEGGFVESLDSRARHDDRQRVEVPVMIRGRGDELQALVVNLSRSGMRIAGVNSMAPDDELEIKLVTSGNGANQEWVKVVVRDYDEAGASIGCRFLQLDEASARLLDAAVGSVGGSPEPTDSDTTTGGV